MSLNPRYLLHILLIGVITVIGITGVVVLGANKKARPPIIRDSEIENTFKEWISPLLDVAGIDKNGINIILVQSPQVNAFVAGGPNIFIYTGLIEKTENPGELIGVVAHELGHIAGGHLIQTRDALKRASYESILGMVLGMGAAIISGDGGAASAIISGSGNIAQRRFLVHSRINESSADQAALRFLEGAEINPSGLITFFEKLGSSELVHSSRQSEYVRTHPLTHNRINAIKLRIQESSVRDKPYPQSWNEEHKRMKAKLLGFINPGYVQWAYDDRDKSIPAMYARAIASYRQNKVREAIKEMDSLISMEPLNPYFQELKGQMLVDFGKVKEAMPYYRKAVSILPDDGLLRIALAHTILESGGESSDKIKKAIKHLERALRDEPRSTTAYRLLATSYGRLGNDNMAKLNLAEEAVLQRRLPYAKSRAKSVQESSEPDSREWIQAGDILSHITNLEKSK